MSQKRKKITLIIALCVLVSTVLLFVGQVIVKNKIKAAVVNLPESMALDYQDIELNLLTGHINLEAPSLKVTGKTTGKVNATIAMTAFSISGFSYWDYMINNKIAVKTIDFKDPKITYYHNALVSTETGDQSVMDNLKQVLHADNLTISNANLVIFDRANDSLIVKAEKLDFAITEFVMDPKSDSKVPFVFNNSILNGTNLKYKAGVFETITLDDFTLDNNNVSIEGFSLKTNYTKEELSKVITTERDHFDLRIPKIEIQNQKVTFENKKINGFSSDKLVINLPVFNIYRDKLVVDDLTPKPLYSKMLRDLDFKLQVKQVDIVDGAIIYKEKVKQDHDAGQLHFKRFNGQLKNVGNGYQLPNQTTIALDCVFMESTPLAVNWAFDVANKTDNFVFKAELGNLKAGDLNPFMQPNLNLKLEGDLIKTYFTIDGNSTTSTVNLKTKYNSFDIIILKDNGKEKNKLLSGIINLFVSKNSSNQPDNFRDSDTKTVTRDSTKSIFNFVWKNTQAGLISAMAGDGTKDE